MNLEAINKWLDEEYGCSYTKLEELHNFYFEKYCDLKQENKQLKERMEYLERSNDRREDIIIEQRQEISDLEDNWDELKKYLHNVDVVVDYSENYDGHFINYDELIDKMQKLEQGSDSNEI